MNQIEANELFDVVGDRLAVPLDGDIDELVRVRGTGGRYIKRNNTIR